jgi:hypothetical protein
VIEHLPSKCKALSSKSQYQKKFWPAAVLTPIIPTMQKAETRRIMVQGKSVQKVTKTLSQRTSQEWWHISVITAIQEALSGKV